MPCFYGSKQYVDVAEVKSVVCLILGTAVRMTLVSKTTTSNHFNDKGIEGERILL